MPFFGKKRLDEIEDFEVERYKARKVKQEEMAPKSVNNHLTVLHKLLHTAAQWKRVDKSKLPTIQWLKAPRPEFDFLDFEEADRLLAAVKDEPEWHAMILVGLRTGLRQGELLALRWEDVDLVAGRLMVRRSVVRGRMGTPKSGKPREVPLSSETIAALKTHRHLRGPLVFCDVDGKLLAKGACKWPIWRGTKKAGLRRIGWHVLRHTFASHLVMRNVPLKTVQELLGHATIEMTMRYAHLSPESKRQAVEVLDGGHARGMPAGAKTDAN